MTTTEVKVIHGRTYLYEIAFAWDKKLHRSRKQTVRYLGRCDPQGHLLHPPRVELEGISSAFPVGALAVFYAQAREPGSPKSPRRSSASVPHGPTSWSP